MPNSQLPSHHFLQPYGPTLLTLWCDLLLHLMMTLVCCALLQGSALCALQGTSFQFGGETHDGKNAVLELMDAVDSHIEAGSGIRAL